MNHFKSTKDIRQLLFVFAFAVVAGSALAEDGLKTATNRLCVMTYNLRYASSNGPNAWPQRRPLMRECIRNVSPDLIGTQEGLYQQLRELSSDLPEYDWIGLGREGGSRGEFMAVFYRKSRFEPQAFDHFWLSDTPDVIGSASWGNTSRRMVTWIRFLDRQTKQEFYLFNTHLDNAVQTAREKGAELIRKRVAELNTSLPLLLVGDFNSAAGNNKAYEILVGDKFFADTWNLAKERRGEGLGTFNSFRAVPRNNERIDWILFRGDKISVDAEEIITFSRDGKFPSDHLPVAAWLRFGD